MAIPRLVPVPVLGAALDPSSPEFDAVVAVTDRLEALPAPLAGPAGRAAGIDASMAERATLVCADDLPGSRLVVAPTGPLGRDHDDVRRFADAARDGVLRARDAGSRKPLLVICRPPGDEDYARAVEVSVLGALAALWEPLEARESLGETKAEPVAKLGVAVHEGADPTVAARIAAALEEGRRLARDMGGTQPERMTPSAMAALCVEQLTPAGVTVEVVSDPEVLSRDYPLLMAVARASMAVERHHPRVIRLEWSGPGEIEETLLFAGKGLSYDTGGSDLKVSGHQAGMSRDKGGAAAVAGLFLTAARLKPKGLRLVAEIGAVRNSIGPDAFVTDEILVSHGGKRVRVGNTDAEGRLVLADLLSHLRVRALGEPGPRLFTLATLTGHAGRATGCYSIALDNGPARAIGIADSLEREGDLWGDPFTVSRLRREDFEFVRPRSKADDLLSCNNEPSSMTARGHQFPMAFLVLAAGLERHGRDGARPLAFTHLDIGGSATEKTDWQHGRPTAAPVVALAARFVLPRVG